MQYQINQTNYSDFSVFSDNRLPGRAYFIPYGSIDECKRVSILNERYSSDQAILLNGEWDFRYYQKGSDLPEYLNTDEINFDKINVPSVWQTTGYEPPYYTNQNYQFGLFPPNIPTDKPVGRYRSYMNGKWSWQNINHLYNSAGVYRKIINISSIGYRYIISFLGVTAGVELYVNGKYHGYGEGSHNSQEFDITDKLSPGDNELVVIVHKWTNGTYLEAQDMFRHNGIFRDVILYKLPEAHIYDYSATPVKNNGFYTLQFNCKRINPSNTELKLRLLDGNKTVAEKTLSENTAGCALRCENVEQWSAETPKLYELYISLYKNGEAIQHVRQYIGFKEIKIEGEIFKLNGKHIYIKGVNRHDTNSKTGYYCTPDDIDQDIRLMKEYNVNAVRTSHYPPDPLLLQLANYYGLYVIDEADIETHGCNGYPIYNIHRISNDLKWKRHYWDRVQAMYERDKNNISVIMWSLGNESGGYKCQDYCYANLKKLTTTPIHYEGVIHSKRMAYDVISEMYTDIPTLKKIRDGYTPWANIKSSFIKNAIVGYHKLLFPTDWIKQEAYSRANKPYLLCEYAHAMGVGPGSLEDYWQVFYSNERFMGGCIWEWADHTVYHENGKYRYTYGGDHNEPYHDGCFCVDGLMFTDRTPHTGALEMKKVYRPIRSTYADGILTFTNTNSFTDSSQIDIICEIYQDNAKASEINIQDIIPAKSSATVAIQLEKAEKTRLDVIYRDKKSGTEIAVEQHIISNTLAIYSPCGAPEYSENSEKIRISSEKANYTFDKKEGKIAEISVLNRKLTSQGSYISDNIFRAPTDNDMYVKNSWAKDGYRDAYTACESVTCANESDRYAITVISSLYGKTKIADIRDEYSFDNSGSMNIDCFLSFNGNAKSYLPRLGKTIKLDSSLSAVTYYGTDTECYPDFKEHGKIGEYTLSASEFMAKYVRPQESGNRMYVEYARFIGADGNGIEISADGKPFNMAVKTMTDIELSECGHIEDLKDSGYIYVNIDGFIGGVGSASCGPEPLDEYKITPDKEYRYSFTVKPIIKNK